jgi:hypothetical protein
MLEEDVGRVCKVLVDKDSRGGVTCRWDGPYLLEVASELGKELRRKSGDVRCCQQFAWNSQWFPVDEFSHGCLQVFFKGRAKSEEDEGKASVQLSCTRHFIAALSDRCIRYTRPLAAGWKAVVRDR